MKTIMQALIDEVQYPLSIGTLENKLIFRGLDAEEMFSAEIAHSSEFKGAIADCLYALIEAPNFNEGDKSFSLSDKALILKKANALYASIGEKEMELVDKPMVYTGRRLR